MLLLQALPLHLLLLKPLLVLPLALIPVVLFRLFLGFDSFQPLIITVLLRSHLALASHQIFAMTIAIAAEALNYVRVTSQRSAMRMHRSA